jgi:hypothetical protein
MFKPALFFTFTTNFLSLPELMLEIALTFPVTFIPAGAHIIAAT